MGQLTDEIAQGWIDRYVEAWKSNDRSKVLALFAEDATYRYGPWDEPLSGPEAIADSWFESPDAPDSWEARYEPIAIRDDLAVIHGRTRYFDSDRTQVRTQYDNVFLVRFDDDGRATDFTEWYIEKPKQPGA